MSGLTELLSQDCIALDVDAATWEEAVLAAGGLLERADIASVAYTGSMIDNVETNGPYIVVAPGFAFAHARPSPAVHRTGMSWVRLAQPVSFGHKTNDPVDLVVALAATDAGAHASAMAELAKVVGSPDKRAALNTAATPAAVLGILGGAQAPAAGELRHRALLIALGKAQTSQQLCCP